MVSDVMLNLLENYSGDCQHHAVSQTENKIPSEWSLTPSIFKMQISYHQELQSHMAYEVQPQTKYAKKKYIFDIFNSG